jgi:hypothetical protein
MHATSSIATTENLELAASLPNWAGSVARELRAIVAALNIEARTAATATAAVTPQVTEHMLNAMIAAHGT